jgi:uncharacterized membrane protein YccF (DUF307 family)
MIACSPSVGDCETGFLVFERKRIYNEIMENEQEKHASSLKKWRKAADIVWNVFLNGVIGYVLYVLFGALFCCLLVGIPFFSSYYRYAKHLFHPANCKLVQNRDVKGFMKVLNILHLVLFGWEMCLIVFLFAGLCYCSVIYIPIGKQLFRQAKFFLNPRSYTFETISYQGVTDADEEDDEEPKKEAEVAPKVVSSVKKDDATAKANPTPVKKGTSTAPAKATAPAKKTPSQAKPTQPIVIQYFIHKGAKPTEGPYADWADKRW